MKKPRRQPEKTGLLQSFKQGTPCQGRIKYIRFHLTPSKAVENRLKPLNTIAGQHYKPDLQQAAQDHTDLPEKPGLSEPEGQQKHDSHGQ